MYKKESIVMHKRRIIFSILAGLNFSLCLVIGTQLNYDNRIDFSFITLIKLLLVGATLTFFFYKIFELKVSLKKDKNYQLKWHKIFIPLMALSLILLFIIYPGNYCYDSVYQYNIYKTGGYGTHYPPLFCIILGTFLDFGKNVFESYEAGLALLVFIQSLFINFVISKIIEYVGNKLKNKKFTIISVIFLATHLPLQILILSSCHDVFFGGFFALLVLEFLKISEEKEEYFSKKSNFLKVGLITILMCLFRNNGFFALIPALIIGFIILKGYRKKFLIILIVPMIIFQAWNQYYAKNISVDTQSVLHESLNMPVMQIARAMNQGHYSVHDKDLIKYFSILCDWSIYKQYPSNSDRIKVCLNDKSVEKNLTGFIDYYISLGLQAPTSYIEATGVLALGLYYPWTTYPENSYEESWIYHPYVEHAIVESDYYRMRGTAANIHRKSNIPFLNDAIEQLLDKNGWSRIYGIRLYWCGAFTTFLMMICIFFTAFKKKYSLLVPLGLVFGLTLTIFLAPVVLFRYIFPIVLCVPIMFYILIKSMLK